LQFRPERPVCRVRGVVFHGARGQRRFSWWFG
jgi:hypothetical protein